MSITKKTNEGSLDGKWKAATVTPLLRVVELWSMAQTISVCFVYFSAGHLQAEQLAAAAAAPAAVDHFPLEPF